MSSTLYQQKKTMGKTIIFWRYYSYIRFVKKLRISCCCSVESTLWTSLLCELRMLFHLKTFEDIQHTQTQIHIITMVLTFFLDVYFVLFCMYKYPSFNCLLPAASWWNAVSEFRFINVCSVIGYHLLNFDHHRCVFFIFICWATMHVFTH